jgi:glucose-1-phosphate adenylyltransferase
MKVKKMINKKKCIAMLLAGGQGSRLGVLTKMRAKPAVSYGGKYKIIDFTLSNCTNSGIDTVGVLTQYQPLELNSYIGTGSSWDLDSITGGVYILPPYQNAEQGEWYSGTANAIFQNIYFIDKFDPEYILVLSGDHIYKMDYNKLLNFHIEKNADATIAVIRVPMAQASRFGIMNTDETGRIIEFEEKPKNPKSDLASMGVYVFNWKKIKKYLIQDSKEKDSSNDFGKNIIPKMLKSGEGLYAYLFKGYWKDVGTIESLWEANMELLEDHPALDLYDPSWKIFSRNPNQPPHFVGNQVVAKTSIVSEGCHLYGTVINSILFPGVRVEKNAVIKDSIIMSNSVIKENSIVERTIIDEEAVVEENCKIGGSSKITVIGHSATIKKGSVLAEGRSVQPSAVCTALSKCVEPAKEANL